MLPQMYTIIGSGFGLYGYLPALIEAYGEDVILPESYRARLLIRSELVQFLPKIFWVQTLEEAISKATGVVLATTPKQQFSIASQILNHSNIKRLILEKPVAPSPLLAAQILGSVLNADIDCRIGFTLLYCDWYSKVNWKAILNNSNEIRLRWTFMAHHFSNNIQTWKRLHSEGGGVLRFYGIHIIALLASLGYTGLKYSTLEGRLAAEPERWKAQFIGDHLPNFNIEIDSLSEVQEFSICGRGTQTSHCHLSFLDPFETEKSLKDQDVRMPALTLLLGSFADSNASFYELYKCVNSLWFKVEHQTGFLTGQQ